MGPELADLARTAGTTMVTLMATQAWETTRDGLVALWQRFLPDRADSVSGELEATREDLLLARDSGDTDTEVELTVEWQARVRRLLVARPEVADELRRILRRRAADSGSRGAYVRGDGARGPERIRLGGLRGSAGARAGHLRQDRGTPGRGAPCAR
ncbi:hypothetical protein [Streptomyces coeruleorubidus]|uniref:hypothetical protein n=1 Tax=Streptomyces coeruleorubidus TaxID=116188 RepID=UPI00340D74D4